MHHVSAIPDELRQPGFGSSPQRRRFTPKADEVRCECVICSSHAFAPRGALSAGRCGNCSSHELRPLAMA